jgi:Tfp pilus assembly protein PilF
MCIRDRSTPSVKDGRFNKFIKDSLEHLSNKQAGKAKAVLHQALREYPLDDELLYHLGNAFFIEGDLDQAEIRFRKSIESNPDSYRAYNNLGVVLRKKGEREAAIQAFNMALEKNDEYERAWLNLGSIFMEIDPPMLREARIFLKRALECDPDLEQARQRLEECDRKLSTNT